jgi:acyl-CoA thioester hydrolase
MRFIYKYRVKWREVDPMYFVRTEEYIDYYRETSTELMRSIGYTYKRLEEENIQMPIMEVSARYFKPLRYDEEITVEAWITKLKSYQIAVEYRIIKVSGEVASSAKILYGIIAKDTEEPHPMPEELKSKLEKFVEK